MTGSDFVLAVSERTTVPAMAPESYEFTPTYLNHKFAVQYSLMRSCNLRKPYSDGAIDDQSLIFNRAFRLSYSDDNYDNNCENRSLRKSKLS